MFIWYYLIFFYKLIFKVFSLLVFILEKYYPPTRYIIHGYIALSILELYLSIFFSSFYIFQNKFLPKIIILVINALIIFLSLKFKKKSLLVYNTFIGSSLLIISISYLSNWLPNIYQLLNNSKFF